MYHIHSVGQNRVSNNLINPFKPEFTIVIFIHYKPRFAVAILDLYHTWRWLEVGDKWKKRLLLKQFLEIFRLPPPPPPP